MRSSKSAERFAALFFPELPTSLVRQLEATGINIALGSGVLAKLTHDELGTIVLVEKGAVKLVGHVGADREQIAAFAFAGELLSIPVNSDNSYSLWALNESEIIAFPAAGMIQAAGGDKDLVRAVFARTLSAMERSRAKAVMLGRKTAQERLATFLCAMAERVGRSTGQAVEIMLPMTRREIADSLGLTIETVSRQFTILRELGIVETRGRSGLSVLDPAGLRSRAAFS